MQIGIMGGTFDPIHLGHLLAAEQAREGAALDEIWFMPSNVPPHKRQDSATTADERWAMVQLAIAGHASFRATRIELERGGISYSVDTVAELQKEFPEHQFHYIIGADMVAYLPKWYQIEKLAGMIGFIGLERPGVALAEVALPSYLHGKVKTVPMPMIDISSTAIRQRRRQGSSIKYQVPEAVEHFIEQHELYQEPVTADHRQEGVEVADESQ